jgi:5-methylcytosine-specific restriction protein A
LLEKVVLEYPEASKDSFTGHPFPSYFRKTIAKSLESFLHLPDMYSIKASAGNGGWAKVPWIAIFNKLVTETVTSGFYCVYFFPVDGSGVYLSLNQGIADIRDECGLPGSRNMGEKSSNIF